MRAISSLPRHRQLLLAVLAAVTFGLIVAPAAIAIEVEVGPPGSNDCTDLSGVRIGQCEETEEPGGEDGSGGSGDGNTSNGSTGSSSPVVDTSAAARLLELANGARAEAGLPPLSPRGDVEEIAVGHSHRMAEQGRLYHNDDYFTPETRRRLAAQSLGENVAYNGDVDAAHERLMQSPPHRANLLDGRFSVAGFGVVRTPDGLYWVTQNFLQPAAAPAPAPAPAPAAPAPPPAPPAPPAPAAEPAASSLPSDAPAAAELSASGGESEVAAASAGADVVLADLPDGAVEDLRRGERGSAGRAGGGVIGLARLLAGVLALGVAVQLHRARRRLGPVPILGV